MVQRDTDSIRREYLHLREYILKELESVDDSDKAEFLRSELGVINQRLDSLESSSSAYLQRYITTQTSSNCCLKLCLEKHLRLHCMYITTKLI